jgi:hypothetical protein
MQTKIASCKSGVTRFHDLFLIHKAYNTYPNIATGIRNTLRYGYITFHCFDSHRR